MPLIFSFAVFLPLIQCIALIWPSSLSNLTHENFLIYSGDDDDDKQVENKKHRDRRKQLEGGSSLIETQDNHMYGSVPLTHWKNFCGFMDLSGEWLNDYGEKEKLELSYENVVCIAVLQQNWWQCSCYFFPLSPLSVHIHKCPCLELVLFFINMSKVIFFSRNNNDCKGTSEMGI